MAIKELTEEAASIQEEVQLTTSAKEMLFKNRSHCIFSVSKHSIFYFTPIATPFFTAHTFLQTFSFLFLFHPPSHEHINPLL